MLRRVLLAPMLSLLAFGGCTSEATHTNADEEIIALERSALDRWAQGNPMGFAEIGAGDVTWFDFAEGEQPRVEGLEALRAYLAPLSGQIPPHTYELVNPTVQIYGNTAILTFHWNASLTDGSPMPKWKATSVYRWNDGEWRQVHAHWSMVQGG